MPKKIDLKGQKFGRLTVLYEAKPHYTSGGNRKVMWHCKCDCGAEKDISSGELLKRGTISCGCYNLEKAKYSKFKQKCKYEFPENENYCIGYTNKGDKFVIDKEDYEAISHYNWFKHRDYFEAHIPMSKPTKIIFLHRLIMGLENDVYDYKIDVDHINSKKWDNRKCNLRIVTKRENNLNRNVMKYNKSGIIGVHYNIAKNIWRVSFNFETGVIKQFDCKTKEEAIKLRTQLEDEYYGEFSFRNSQELAKQYEIKEEIDG